MPVGTAGFAKGNMTGGFGRKRRAPAGSPLLTGLVAYWKLEEASGTREDAHTGNIDLALAVGSVGNAAGKHGNAAAFVADGNVLQSSNTALRPTGDFTVAAWVNAMALAGASSWGRGIASFHSGAEPAAGDWYVSVHADGVLRFAYNTTSGSADPTATSITDTAYVTSLATWYHLAFRRSGGTKSIWVNGVSRGLSASTPSFASNWGLQNFNLAQVWSDPAYCWDGLIDSVGIWSRALSDAEIGELYATGDGLDYPFGGGAPAVTYLHLDRFLTDDAAPVTSPRAGEPGPGALAFTDANGVLSVADDSLVINGTPAGNSDGFISTSSQVRAAGLALFMHQKSATVSGVGAGNGRFGFVSSNAVDGTEALSLAPAAAGREFYFAYNGGGAAGPLFLYDPEASLNSVDMGLVCRGTGALFLLRVPGRAWEIGYVAHAGTASPLWPRHRLSANAYDCKRTNIALVQLPAPFDDDWGLVTQRTASASANAMSTCNADCLLEATRTLVAADVWELSFRRGDDDNRMFAEVNEANNTLKLFERNGGVNTERATASVTFNAGSQYRVVVTAMKTRVDVYANDSKWLSYTSATFNQTTGGANAAKTSHAATEFNAWPKALSGTALSVLETYYDPSPSLLTVYVDPLAGDSLRYNPGTRSPTGGTYRCYVSPGDAYALIKATGTMYLQGPDAGTIPTNTTDGLYYGWLAGQQGAWKFDQGKSITVRPVAGKRVTMAYDPANPPIIESEVGSTMAAGGGGVVTIEGDKTLRVCGPFGAGPNAVTDSNLTMFDIGGGSFDCYRAAFYLGGHSVAKGGVNFTECLCYGGGQTNREHGHYSPGGTVDRGNVWVDFCGWGLHAPYASSVLDAHANIVMHCGHRQPWGVGGGGAIINRGSVHRVTSNLIIDNYHGDGLTVFALNEGTAAAYFHNNALDGNSTVDIHRQVGGGANPVTGTDVGHNHKNTIFDVDNPTDWYVDGGTDSSGPLGFKATTFRPTRWWHTVLASDSTLLTTAGADLNTALGVSDRKVGLDPAQAGPTGWPTLTAAATWTRGSWAAASSTTPSAPALVEEDLLFRYNSDADQCYGPFGHARTAGIDNTFAWWEDEGPRYRHASQDDSAARPTLRSNGVQAGTGVHMFVRPAWALAGSPAEQFYMLAAVRRAAGEQLVLMGCTSFKGSTDEPNWQHSRVIITTANKLRVYSAHSSSDYHECDFGAVANGSGDTLVRVRFDGTDWYCDATGMSEVTMTAVGAGATLNGVALNTILGSPLTAEWSNSNCRVKRLEVARRDFTLAGGADDTAARNNINALYGVTL